MSLFTLILSCIKRVAKLLSQLSPVQTLLVVFQFLSIVKDRLKLDMMLFIVEVLLFNDIMIITTNKKNGLIIALETHV